MSQVPTEKHSESKSEPEKVRRVPNQSSGSYTKRSLMNQWGALLLAILAVFALILWLAYKTRDSRAGIAAYSRLTVAVNKQDIEVVKNLCTERYVRTHSFRPAEEGGLVGFPRFIQKNFQAWREGDAVWVCPTNRVGPIYQFLKENGEWKYDGLIGLLRSGNTIIVLPEESRLSEEDDSLLIP